MCKQALLFRFDSVFLAFRRFIFLAFVGNFIFECYIFILTIYVYSPSYKNGKCPQ